MVEPKYRRTGLFLEAALLPVTCLVAGSVGMSDQLGHIIAVENMAFLLTGLCVFFALPIAVVVAVSAIAIAKAKPKMTIWLLVICSLLHMALIPWSLYAGKSMVF